MSRVVYHIALPPITVSQRSAPSHPASPYVWMLFGALAFATMGAVTHALGQHIDWRLIAVARTALALVFSLSLALWANVRLVLFRPRTLWLRSIAGSISLVCTFFALPRLPVGDVLALTNIFPLWIALLSWPVLGVRPTVGVWVAVASGIAGVWLIQQPHLDESGAAAVVAIAASFSTCVAMMGLHRLHHLHPLAVVVHFSGVSLAVCVASLALDLFQSSSVRWFQSVGDFNPSTIGMLITVGASATVGQLFLTKAFAAGPPARVSVVSLAQVVFGLGFDIWLWQRRLEPLTVIGIALVLVPTGWLLIRHQPDVVTETTGDG
jgi:drug/metabolite transporter (DMT)-like permease